MSDYIIEPTTIDTLEVDFSVVVGGAGSNDWGPNQPNPWTGPQGQTNGRWIQAPDGKPVWQGFQGPAPATPAGPIYCNPGGG
jgi:hypothetical protein